MTALKLVQSSLFFAIQPNDLDVVEIEIWRTPLPMKFAKDRFYPTLKVRYISDQICLFIGEESLDCFATLLKHKCFLVEERAHEIFQAMTQKS